MEPVSYMYGIKNPEAFFAPIQSYMKVYTSAIYQFSWEFIGLKAYIKIARVPRGASIIRGGVISFLFPFFFPEIGLWRSFLGFF